MDETTMIKYAKNKHDSFMEFHLIPLKIYNFNKMKGNTHCLFFL